MERVPFTVGTVVAPPVPQDPGAGVEAAVTLAMPAPMPAGTKVRWIQNIGPNQRLTGDKLAYGGLVDAASAPVPSPGVPPVEYDYTVTASGTQLTLTSHSLGNPASPSKTGLDAGIERLSVGDDVVITHQKYSANCMTMVRCAGVELTDLVFRAAPGAAAWWHGCANVTITGCDFVAQPGEPFSLAADGFNFNRIAGSLAIADCSFSRPGDDSLNIHANYYEVLDVDRPGQRIKVKETQFAWNAPTAPSGTWRFSGADLSPLPSGQVVSTTCAQTSCNSNTPGEEWWLNFSGPVTAWTNASWAIPEAAMPDMVTVQNCDFVDNAIRGCFLASRNITISDCTFERIASAAVALPTDVGRYFEGPGNDTVLIQDCVIHDVNYGGYAKNGAISVFANHNAFGTTVAATYAASAVHRDLTIQGCTISQTPFDTFFLNAVDNVDILGNDISNVGYWSGPNPWWFWLRPEVNGSPAPFTAVFLHEFATSVLIDFNVISAYGAPSQLHLLNGDTTGLVIGPNNVVQ